MNKKNGKYRTFTAPTAEFVKAVAEHAGVNKEQVQVKTFTINAKKGEFYIEIKRGVLTETLSTSDDLVLKALGLDDIKGEVCMILEGEYIEIEVVETEE